MTNKINEIVFSRGSWALSDIESIESNHSEFDIDKTHELVMRAKQNYLDIEVFNNFPINEVHAELMEYIKKAG